MLYPENIKKYAGSIIETNKKIIIKYKTRGRIFIVKEFYFKDYNSREDTKTAAIKYKKKWAIVNNLVKNKYEIINNDHTSYLKIYVKNDKYFLGDIKDIDLIEKYNWNIGKDSRYVKTIIKEKKILFHELKVGKKKVIHKNKNKMDNRSDNLEVSDTEIQKYPESNIVVL